MRIEGGSTLKTFQMPPWAERVQYILKSPSGRPVKAKVELWIGPIRCVHELIYDCMGSVSRESSFPVKATLQFKKLSPVLKISTDSTFEFPLECGVFIPKDDAEQKMWGKTTKDMFYGGSGGDKQVVQGGLDYVSKKSGGSIRSFDIPASWEKTQIMCWCVKAPPSSHAKQPRTPPCTHPSTHLPTTHLHPLLTHSQVGRCRQEVVQVEHRDPPGAEQRQAALELTVRRLDAAVARHHRHARPGMGRPLQLQKVPRGRQV